MKIFVHGIGVLGPGIESWKSCQSLFKEQCLYDDSVTPAVSYTHLTLPTIYSV